MSKKGFVFSLISAACILLLLFAACGKDSGEGGGSGANESESADPGGAPDEALAQEEPKPLLPDKTYGGYEVKFLVMGDSYNHYQSREIGAESETGDIINDAVYKRNMYLEKSLDVLIKAIASNAIMNDAKKSILAGGNDYDVVMPVVDDGVKALQPGLFCDLNQIPYLDLSKPWWDPRARENLTINGRCYFATGDISILDNECTMVIFFNKQIIRDNASEDPYKLVREGKWTLDRQFEISRGVTRDVDGDGAYTVGEDVFGMQISSNTPNAMFIASGERIVDTDPAGKLEIRIFNERSVDVVSKIFEICNDPLGLTPRTKGGNDYTVYIPSFGRGKILFSHLALIDINFFRNDDIDFGILPYPKYDGNQKEYNNFISTICVPAVAIPGNCEDTEKIGAVLEAMAYESVGTLTYAYYDQTLNTRLIRDTESSDMLDIIFKTRVYDIGFMFNWGGVGTMLNDMYSSRNVDFVSAYEKLAEKAQAAMDKASVIFED